jgi:hypothetical protein
VAVGVGAADDNAAANLEVPDGSDPSTAAVERYLKAVLTVFTVTGCLCLWENFPI